MLSKLVLLFLFITYSRFRPANATWSFASDFKIGVATSAYQIEGGYNADGKGQSVLDVLFQQQPQLVADGSNGNIACNSYSLWETDVNMIKNLSASHYRFSLSWPRLYPYGWATTLNPAGVLYYNNLINALIANNIEPIVTIFHWDLPQTIGGMGNINAEKFVDFYAELVRNIFSLYGDRVKTWITFNEPQSVCQSFNALLGSTQSYYPSGVIEYQCSFNLLLAHAKAYQIYKKEFWYKQKGVVGISLNTDWFNPATTNQADIDAAERGLEFGFGLYAHPLVYGDFPQVVKDRVDARSKLEGFKCSRLLRFSEYHKSLLVGSYDFIGVNHYTTINASDSGEALIGQPSFASDMRVTQTSYPSTSQAGQLAWGFNKLLKRIKDKYDNPTIFITENGASDTTGTLTDTNRVSYLQAYMNATLQAINVDKVNIVGYTVWSLMDNFEWISGYTVKFGLYNVNFNDANRARTAKSSCSYFKSVCQNRVV